jgi:hypothetical protein
MTLRVLIFAIALALSFLGGGEAFGTEENQENNKQPAGTVDPIQKGATELAAVIGFGLAHEIWNGVADTRFLVLGARIGHVVSGARGPGFLKGNLEISGEFLPVFLVDQGDTTYGASATLLFRHFLSPGSRWRPYVALGFGALATKRGVPEGEARVNFTPQIGLGLSYSIDERFVLYFDYRLHHMSDGGRGNHNPGINSSFLQFSVSIFRW